ncbi:SET domain protein [Tricharina praecox]|uniref:SET domain protein n=1 Tax=Tricharina praecox TaxID=43433 RepID=UPI00221F4FC5|nr:SET domain protein [Tricharina praecox]KAI5854794.1 SET domain protein [Tricharina praecox]
MEPETDEFTQQNERFLHWLQNSMSFTLNPKIAIADLRSSGAGRGLVALSALSPDETLFRLPRSSCLTPSTSSLPPLSATSASAYSALTPWLQLMLTLLYESRASSSWAPYLTLLPQRFDTLMYWAPHELEWLRGSKVLDKVGRQAADETFRTELLPIVRANPDVFGELPEGAEGEQRLLDAAHRVGSAVMAYSFDLSSGDESDSSDDDDDDGEEEGEEEGEGGSKKRYKAMVPLADLLNADVPANCRLFQTATHLEMRTLRELPAGAQLFNDYGALPRSDLLRRYGYTTRNYAPFDVVEVPAPMVIAHCGGEAGREDRIEYLLEEGVLEDAFDLQAQAEGAVPDELVVVVNTLLASNAEFAAWKEKEKLPKPRISEEAAEVLARVMRERLGEYATTIEEDERLLETEITGRERDAVEVRLGEKRILQATYKELERRVNEKKRAAEAETGDRSAKRMRS